ncbi:Fic family protein [Haliscomenobacter sp.]|uniref:Fic family protein n=1 Tax=Haliscomenobacter sp. TaxID=2717303 RepID=UPI003593A167
MNNLLQQIDGLKKELEGLQPIEAEFQRKLDRKFRLEFNYNSNHLEGNTLTYGETELLLYFDQTKGDHTMREYEEMQAHDLALKLVKEWAEDLERPLSEADIKELNKVILVKPFWKDAITPDGQGTRRQIMVGEYKKYPNSVRLQNGEMFDYASPTDTPIKMGELIQWFRSACEKVEVNPVELAAKLHHQFVLIHPFDDGNGRISRLLMNYVFWRFGFPPIVIKSSDKQNYLRALNWADVGEMEFFVEYVGKQVLWSLELSVKAEKGEDIEEENDVDKEIVLLKQKVRTLPKQKSPKSKKKIFNHFQEEVLNEFWRSVSHFDEFFTESKKTYAVDNNELEGNGIEENPFGVNEFVPKIYEHNIYKEEIDSIEWKEIKYGAIKGIEKDYVIILGIEFNNENYRIYLKINGNGVYSLKKKYSDLLTQSKLNELISTLKKQLLARISNSIENS